MNRLYITCYLVFTTFLFGFAQEKLEIRLVPTNVSESADELCFDTQFKNISNTELRLAGQNYRLFYDALQLKFKPEKLRSQLPQNSYGYIDLNQSLHNIDARGYGDLKFGQNLGFINYSIGLSDDAEKIVTLPPSSPWVSTTNICFQANDTRDAIHIIWAREGLTSGYATAFTEVSQQVAGTNETKPVLIQVYQDFIKLSDRTGVNDPRILQSTQNH